MCTSLLHWLEMVWSLRFLLTQIISRLYYLISGPALFQDPIFTGRTERLEILLCSNSPACSCHLPPVYTPAALPVVPDGHSRDFEWTADTNTFKYIFYTFAFQKIISSVQFCQAPPVGAWCSKGVIFRASTAASRGCFVKIVLLSIKIV